MAPVCGCEGVMGVVSFFIEALNVPPEKVSLRLTFFLGTVSAVRPAGEAQGVSFGLYERINGIEI